MTLNIKAGIKFPTFVSNNIKGEISVLLYKAAAPQLCCVQHHQQQPLGLNIEHIAEKGTHMM